MPQCARARRLSNGFVPAAVFKQHLTSVLLPSRSKRPEWGSSASGLHCVTAKVLPWGCQRPLRPDAAGCRLSWNSEVLAQRGSGAGEEYLNPQELQSGDTAGSGRPSSQSPGRSGLSLQLRWSVCVWRPGCPVTVRSLSCVAGPGICASPTRVPAYPPNFRVISKADTGAGRRMCSLPQLVLFARSRNVAAFVKNDAVRGAVVRVRNGVVKVAGGVERDVCGGAGW